MGFLSKLFKGLSAPAKAGSPYTYWVYAQCRRCGEPLRTRINLANEPSMADDGERWIVRKALSGSGARRCFQTVEVTLTFDARKENVVESTVQGGELITEAEYQALLEA